MKYISIDIETTGLDPVNDQILEFAAILEDTNSKEIYDLDGLHSFEAIFAYERLVGNPYALSLNKRLLEIMVKYYGLKRKGTQNAEFVKYKKENNIYEITDKNSYIPFIEEFEEFLYYSGYLSYSGKKLAVNPAGKNYGSFDGQFLKNIGLYDVVPIKQRSIDPAILYVDWENDNQLPSLEKCKERAGLKDVEVTHKAIDDAWDVIRILRKQYVKQ